ncbi:DNA-binding response regulator [Clostridia bacterium]|nr:DNA-binding response regulator [Clostridia bacterium]
MEAVILLVEDNPHIMTINRDKLTRAGYRVLEADTLQAASAILTTQQPDLIVLDVMLPDGNGVAWCANLRGDSGEPPVLFLSAKDETPDILDGFEAGGDDYLTKPYDLNILLARIKVLLDKASRVPQRIDKGRLTLDPLSGRAYTDGVDLLLTQKEFALLLLFTQHEGRPLDTEYLYERVWGHSMNENDNAVKYQISRLRGKIADCGFEITAVHKTAFARTYSPPPASI